MNRRRTRVAAVTVATLGVFLTMTSAAFAHATLSPPVAETGVLQQFTLAVPTEKEGATTTAVAADRARRAWPSTRSRPSPAGSAPSVAPDPARPLW